jgi:hypothetical protein
MAIRRDSNGVGWLGLSLASLCLGCGSSIVKPTAPNMDTLNLPSAHTQQWIHQLSNGALPPGYSPGASGVILNTAASVSADAEGNVFIGGFNAAGFTGDASPVWVNEAFVGKFDPQGNQRWLQRFGDGLGFDAVVAVLNDSLGNIYACGTTTGSFPGYSNPTHQLELMVAKLTTDGTIERVEQYPTNLLPLNLQGVALTPAGMLAFWGTAQGMSNGIGNSGFLQLVDPLKETVLWQRTFAGSNYPQSIASDRNGDLLVIGQSQGDFPGTPDGSAMPFVVKIDAATGNSLWQQQFAAYSTANKVFLGIDSVATDASGNVFVGGASVAQGEELCSGLCLAPTLYDQEMFVAKIEGKGGSIDWAKSLGTGKGDGVTGLAITPNAQLYAVGFTNGLVASTFSQPQDDIFALKLDSNGEVLWAQQFGAGPWVQGPMPSRGVQAASDAYGDLLLVGETQGVFTGYSNATHISEIFVTKFSN